jgi:membrane associated rhomboid family serine protease
MRRKIPFFLGESSGTDNQVVRSSLSTCANGTAAHSQGPSAFGQLPDKEPAMLYDRPYMREAPGEPDASKASMVTTLLVITIGVFVLQQVLNVFFPGMGGRGNTFLADWFALSGQNFQELKVWTILSYGFLHSTQGFLHILGNMLGLFFIGRMIEPILGRDRFLFLYIGSMLVGGLVYLLFHLDGPQMVVGASAAVFGIMGFFCMLRPEQPITLLLFFVLPLTVKPKWVFRVSLAISAGGLLFYELPGNSYIAHSAHLGGILAGFAYYRFVFNAQGSGPFGRSASAPAASVELPEWFKRKKNQPATRNMNYTVNRSSRDQLQQEVDRILDKINASGFGSLSDDEKQTLDQARDILSK